MYKHFMTILVHLRELEHGQMDRQTDEQIGKSNSKTRFN